MVPDDRVPPGELRVLEALWSAGPSTIRALADELYPGGGASAYATVQRLLERLEAKGLVARDRRERAHVFRARLEHGEFLLRRLRALADRLCSGSLAPLVTQLVRGGLSARERDELRALLDERPRTPGEGGDEGGGEEGRR